VVTGSRRDSAALAEGLTRWMAAHPELVAAMTGDPAAPTPRVGSVVHADGGLANETVLVDLGPDHGGLVVRLPPLLATFPEYDLAPQAAVQNAVAVAGVPAPAPAVMERDPDWIGCTFLAMPRVAGDIAGPAPVFDPYVREAGESLQRRMHDALIDTVADVHAVPWQAHGLGALLGEPSLHDVLARWADYVEWSSQGEPLPGLAAALEWCRAHVPAERDPVLLWGDVRLGNLIFDGERRVAAVLDWDLSSLGPPEMDLGWHFGLEFMMAQLFGQTVPGFPGRPAALDRYEERSGHAVRDLDWHEVFALVRALAINDRHQRISGDPRRRDNPMAAVLLERMASARLG
jgi:aminoglycoside phosphotransferase (APT) family kinase protein